MNIVQQQIPPNSNGSTRKLGTVPNAMLSTSNPTVRKSEILEALLKRLHMAESEKLYPRLALFEVLSGFKDKPKSREQTTDTFCNSRRDFLDSFAYLCDIKKGGGTVTASALQQSSTKVFLWLAANEGIRDDVLRYANKMLDNIRQITTENQGATTDTIFFDALEMCRPRINVYKTQVRKYARICRMRLKYQDQTAIGMRTSLFTWLLFLTLIVRNIRTKLKRLSQPPPSLTAGGYVGLCFDMRGNDCDRIREMSKAPEDDYMKLAHYLWRLGATRVAAIRVVEAVVAVPSLKQISGIQTVSALPISEKTIDRSCMSPHELLHGIFAEWTCQNPTEYEPAFTKLHQRDQPLARPLHTHMKSRAKIETRVHAELQIADHFSRSSNMDFVGNDKYIGCSKPACYFCYNWLSFHKHSYVLPATHHKIIPFCRAPDNGLTHAGANVVLDMYSKISRRIGQDIVESLKEDAHPRRHYMSTEAPTQTATLVSEIRS